MDIRHDDTASPSPTSPSGPDDADDTAPVCSARGCGETATWAVIWNNPKIHTPDREKIWAACDDHRQKLADFLSMRSMLLRVDPISDAG